MSARDTSGEAAPKEQESNEHEPDQKEGSQGASLSPRHDPGLIIGRNRALGSLLRRGAELSHVAQRAPGGRALVLGLHGAIGNRAVSRLLNAGGAPVQRKLQRGAGGDSTTTPEVRAAAAEGLQSPGGRLPHIDIIQRSFGRHDVSHIQAHTGERASRGARAMGARAFATSHHVAFEGAPDLHTAAHEAAHVIQQRGGVQLAGGVGREGDPYERHADEVADRVVRGLSSEALLDRYAPAGGGSARSGAAVIQRKLRPDMKEGDRVVRHTKEGDEDHYEIRRVRYHQGRVLYDIVDNNTGEDAELSVGVLNPKWGPQDAKEQSRKEWEESEKQKQADYDPNKDALSKGELFLSSNYRQVNSLLGAIQKVYGSPDVRDAKFQLVDKLADLLAMWKNIALDWHVAVKDDVEKWTVEYMLQTFEVFKQINSVWSKFPKRDLPSNAVYRGDSDYLYDSYDFLDPEKNKYPDGVVPIGRELTWPTIMSTSYDRGGVKTHRYIDGRQILWVLGAKGKHEGKKLGDNNPSETEATFPAGTRIRIDNLIIRRKDKSAYSDIAPDSVEVIVEGEIISKEPEAKDDKPKKKPPLLRGVQSVRNDMLFVPKRPAYGAKKEDEDAGLSSSDKARKDVLKNKLKNAKKKLKAAEKKEDDAAAAIEKKKVEELQQELANFQPEKKEEPPANEPKQQAEEKELPPEINWGDVDKAALQCGVLANVIKDEMSKADEPDEKKLTDAVATISKTLEGFTIFSQHAIVREARLEAEQHAGAVILGVLLDENISITRKIKLWKLSEKHGHALHNAIVGNFELERLFLANERKRPNLKQGGDHPDEHDLLEKEQQLTAQLVAMYGHNLGELESSKLHPKANDNDTTAADETKELTEYARRNTMLARILARQETSAHASGMAEVHPNFWGLFLTPPQQGAEILEAQSKRGTFKTNSPSGQGAHVYNLPGHTRAMFMRAMDVARRLTTFATKGSGMDLTRPDKEYFSQFKHHVDEAKQNAPGNANEPVSIFKYNPSAPLGHRTVGYGDWSMASDDFHNFESKFNTAKKFTDNQKDSPYKPLLKSLAQPMSVATLANTIANRQKLPTSVLAQADTELSDMPTQITTVAEAETARRLHRVTKEDQYRQPQALKAGGFWRKSKRKEDLPEETELGGKQYEPGETMGYVLQYANVADWQEGDETKGVRTPIVARGSWEFKGWHEGDAFVNGNDILYYYDLTPELDEYKLATREMAQELHIPKKYLTTVEERIKQELPNLEESAQQRLIKDHQERVQTGYALVYSVLGSLAVFTQEGDTSGFIGDSFESRNISTGVRDADEWGEGYLRFAKSDDKVTMSGVMTLVGKELGDAAKSLRMALRSAGVRREYAPELFEAVDQTSKAISVASTHAFGAGGQKTMLGDHEMPLLAFGKRMSEAKSKKESFDEGDAFWALMSEQEVGLDSVVELNTKLKNLKQDKVNFHSLMDPKNKSDDQETILSLKKSAQEEIHKLMIVFFRDFVAQRIPAELGELRGLFAALYKGPPSSQHADDSSAQHGQHDQSAKGHQDDQSGGQGNDYANEALADRLVTVDPNDHHNIIHTPPALLEAYRADLPSSAAYLSESEGHALARAWNVYAEVFTQQAAPQGSNIYVARDGRRFRQGQKTHEDGNCLIHGLSIILTGQNAEDEEVREARRLIGETASDADLTLQAQDLVRGYIEGNAHGVGRNMRELLDRDFSVQNARVRYQREASKGGGGMQASSSSSSSSQSGQLHGNAGEGRIAAAGTYGLANEQSRGYLLFVNGNHYIVLEPIVDAQNANLAQDPQPLNGQVASLIASNLAESKPPPPEKGKAKKVTFAPEVSDNNDAKPASKAPKEKPRGLHGRSTTIHNLDLDKRRQKLTSIVRALMPSDVKADPTDRREFIELWVEKAEEDKALMNACAAEWFQGANTVKLIKKLTKMIKIAYT
jgi:hypothetical protein